MNDIFKFNFDVSEPLKISNLIFYGISSRMETEENNYLSLPKALEQNLVDVDEISTEGMVESLKITNKSPQKLLILDSEQIVGTKLKQNRVVNTTILVPGRTTINIPTSCCEQHRWSPIQSNRFSVSESLYFVEGRINRFSDMYHSPQAKQADQYRIWSEIDDKLDEFNTSSYTSSVDRAYQKKKSHIEKIVKSFQPEPQDIGVVYGVGNRLIGMDIFSSNQIFRTYLPKIIRSVALDSFKRQNVQSSLSKKDALKFFELVRRADKQEHRAVESALGQEIRFDDEMIVGSGLFYKQKAVHFAAFLKDQEAQMEYRVA
jgi:hypothetical protein